ncbi:hypothetical protein SmJEL517_g02492 [Synchytrium microbalum]|uniref:DUF155 domain-containing protein n=1 Tax=Synchytrium microbalum TaxID=1806994 RepID=A0A507C1J8_9FUNG|nr:uncharacterized protein SmJEL517_g02492 [Synchytrium microbalum]TPX34987.1 hypothetical protein SmJEL517_g02492 [Synchytrium microbalum]
MNVFEGAFVKNVVKWSNARNLQSVARRLAPTASSISRSVPRSFCTSIRTVYQLQYRTFSTKPLEISRAETSRKKKGVRGVGADELSSSPVPVQRATAFCTAEEYNIEILLPLLQRHYAMQPYITEFVYHFKLRDSNLPEGGPEAFFFDDGTFVTWGATPEQNELLLLQIKAAEINGYRGPENEFFDYFQDPEQVSTMVGDTIVVGSDLAPYQAKLAFSSGMARSVKLGALESLLDTHLSKNRHIPSVLLSGRKLPLSRRAVLQSLGELFSLRGNLNLHNELLDSPDFLWSSKNMEKLFDRISRNLDVVPRIAVFNKKLDYANELADVLRNHLHEQHSLKLEWAIIILIAIEIGFELVHYAERLGYVDLDVLAKKQPSKLENMENMDSSNVPPEVLEEIQAAIDSSSSTSSKSN